MWLLLGSSFFVLWWSVRYFGRKSKLHSSPICFLRETGQNRSMPKKSKATVYCISHFYENSANNLYLCWLWKAIIHKSPLIAEFYDSIEMFKSLDLDILWRAQHNFDHWNIKLSVACAILIVQWLNHAKSLKLCITEKLMETELDLRGEWNSRLDAPYNFQLILFNKRGSQSSI